MDRKEAVVGTRVKTLQAWVGVPVHTEGVIDERYDGGVMVAWDLPDQPLPSHYVRFDGRAAVQSRILRDGFSLLNDELTCLEVVQKGGDANA